jgi:chitinase
MTKGKRRLFSFRAAHFIRKCLLFAGVSILFSVDTACTAPIAQWRTGYYSPIFPIGSGMPASGVHYAAFTHIVHVSLISANAQGGIDSTTYGLTPAAIQDFIRLSRAAGVSPIVGLAQLAGPQTYLTQSINNGYLNTLVTNVMSYVNTYGYDGVDLDWEVDLGSNATNFQALVNALRAQLPRSSGKLLLATFGANERIAAANAANLDQVNLQCYDLAAASWGLVWHNSAIYNLSRYTYPAGGDPAYTIQWRANSHLAAGVPTAKIGIGIPFYGYVWSGGTAPGRTGGSYSTHSIEYRDLVKNPTLWQDAYMQRDAGAGNVPYLSIQSLNTFVTYEDAPSIAEKWRYVKQGNFGGLMVFNLGSDWNDAGLTLADKHPLAEALRIAAATIL